MKPKSKIASFFYALFVNLHNLKFIEKIEEVVAKMRYSEKILFYIFSFIFVISGIVILFRLNNLFLVEVPAFGGSFTEGVIGSPRFINPVLAISDTDKDMVSLVYSGLLKVKDGGYEPDLAKSYQITNNGTVYDFVIRDDAYFHDGKEVTADDIIFTIQKILDPIIKSSKKVNWDGVRMEKVNNKEVRFTLSKPYSPFLSALTLGILPKHIWQEVTPEEFPFSQININPVGSGPYKVEKISTNSGGIPDTITLSSWDKYTLGRPKIQSITFKFFQNETDLMKAYNDKSIDNVAGLSPIGIKKAAGFSGNFISDISLPRVFGVFLNQNVAQVFLNEEIRQALDIAAPKQEIIDQVLYGFGQVLNGPTPEFVEKDKEKAQGNIEAAKVLLSKAGWKANSDGILQKTIKKQNVLFSFSITTSDAPELKQTAEILKKAWEKLGASVSIKVFEAGDLSQNVIRGRKYDALLFGEVIGENSDLYPFWHSSQRNDPGLNISLYANITVDKALEDIQNETDKQDEAAKKEIVVSEIQRDVPAIFLFSPNFLYITAPKIKNITLKNISSLNERFLYVSDWYIETDKVWKFFEQS